MTFHVRRVVTGHDAGGRAVIVSDGVPARTIATDTGVGVSDVLLLDGPPATADAGGDPPGAFALEPPPGGANFRVIRLPPPAAGAAADERWLRVAGDDSRHPGMHKTDTLDCVIVLDGELVLELADGEHSVRAGDVVIQRGTDHRWRVAGDNPCTYAVLMRRPAPGANPPAQLGGPGEHRDAGPPVRRLVTGPAGAVVDGLPPVVLSPAAAQGVRMLDLWQTGGPLRTTDQGGDPTGGFQLEPLGGGVACRIVELPAGHDPGARGWHTTNTIDIDLVLTGELELELPDQPPVTLGPGHIVVQRGTNHRWRAVGNDDVRFFAAMFALGAAPSSGPP